jgi:uncharacterized protein YqeY
MDPVTATVGARLRADLMTAMKARDTATVTALRTVLAAISNAEAPPIDSAPSEVAGRLVEHRRIELTDGDIDGLLRAQIADRADTIATYRVNGRLADADVLHHEITVIERYLG